MTTLFLDRDGVINECMPPGQYVTCWSEFKFIEGSIQAIYDLRFFFNRIVVITNQQGVGKKIMSIQQLEDIHKRMQACLEENSCSVDRIYYCPHLKTANCNCRKPEVGMAIQAQKDFPDIDFKAAVIAGDFASDLKLGHRLGMKTILISNKQFIDSKPNFFFDSLSSFSRYLSEHPNILFP